jgi:hypothetical protein
MRPRPTPDARDEDSSPPRRPANTAAQGRRIEWAARDYLILNGYEVVRAAASKGPADLVAIKPGQVLIINVKRTTAPGPKERAALLRVASHLPGIAVPLVALGPASRLTFRLLTGCAASAWVPWTADEVTG